MIKQGGIYKLRDSDSYIVIVDIVKYVYYYEVLINDTNLSVNNRYIVNTLDEQMDIGLKNQHEFYLRENENTLKNKLDGYLGQITDKQFFNLRIELEDVDFE